MKVYLERGKTIPGGREGKRRRRDMKSRLSTLVSALILGALVLSACGPSTVQPAEPPTTTPTEVAVEARPTAQVTEAPKATPTEQPTKLPTTQPTTTSPPVAQPTQTPDTTPTEAVAGPAEVAEDDTSDWKTYTNEEHGYSLRYPPDCTFGPMPAGCKQKPPEERPLECLCFLNAEDPDRVFLQAFTGENDSLKLAGFSVARLALDPPPGMGVIAYMREKFPHYEEIPDEPNMEVGGLPAVGLYAPASPMAYSYAEIYLIKDDKLLLIHMQDVDEQANSELYGRISSTLDISGMEALAPAAGQRVVAWLGRVVSLPAGGQFDDYVILEPEGAGEVGLTGADNTVEAQIQMLRDSTTYAHFWGTLTCPVLDYGGCELVVARLREDRPGPAFAPDQVEGWEGTIVSFPPGSQFDDYFLQAGDFAVGYGIETLDPALAAQLAGLRDTGTSIRIWGQLTCPAIDAFGTGISVNRVEVVAEPRAPVTSAPDGYQGWKTYTSERFGYTLMYPGDAEVISTDLAVSVQFVGPRVDNRRWPWLEVRHFDSDFYHPPAGTDVHRWLTDSGHPSGEVGPEVELAGLPTAHHMYKGGPAPYDYDEYYFIKGDRLFCVMIAHTGDRQDWDLYDKFLQSITFVSEPTAKPVEPVSSRVDGWVGTIARLPPGSQLGGYFERDDGQRSGIWALEEAVRQQVERYRWTGAQVQVWGQLLTGVPDMGGRQIQVERIEALSGPAVESRNLSPFAVSSASSVLPSDRWGTYHPWSAIDGLLSSPWVEAARGPGIGEWIMLTFPGTVEVHRIGLDVGYDRDEGDTFRNENLFFANNRVKRATIKFSTGDEMELSFADERRVQMSNIAPVKTTYVQVVIDEVYPGSRWDDTCLAELEVWGVAE
jgi:hypothetical protein